MRPSHVFYRKSDRKPCRVLSLSMACGLMVASGCGMRTSIQESSDDEEWREGGSTKTGGNQVTGGNIGAGGMAQKGGAIATKTGGNISSGGTISLGGSKTGVGGMRLNGGAVSGGSIATGGERVRGGSPAQGGRTVRMGGNMARGGVPALGGTIAETGGIIFISGGAWMGGGKSETGGVVASKGGRVAYGGAIMTGGVPSVGGSMMVQGGATSTGGTCALIDSSLEELIDDMNDMNRFIPSIQGRSGAWSTSHDGSPEVMMFPDPAEGFVMSNTGDACHQYAVYVKGSGAVLGGSSVRFGLGSPYNASHYGGISFWAKSDSGRPQVVRVAFPDKDTIPDGGLCQPSIPSGPSACWDHFGYRITLNTTWTKHTIWWDQLTQDGWAKKDAFDKTTIYQVLFQLSEGANYAIWIDDVAFRFYPILD